MSQQDTNHKKLLTVLCFRFWSFQTVFGFSLYAMSHDEETFPEPWRFEPGRWLRDGRERPYPFGSIPFGFGVRGCVGRRIAELEMHLSLARVGIKLNLHLAVI